MTAILSFKVLDPSLDMSPVFTLDERHVTMEFTAATKGDQYFTLALVSIHK